MGKLDSVTKATVILVTTISVIGAIIAIARKNGGVYPFLERVLGLSNGTMNVIYAGLIVQALCVVTVNVATLIKYQEEKSE